MRVGLIGMGYWGPHYARILSEFPDTELAWCCDRDAAALSLARQRHPAVPTTTDSDDVLADETVSAVVICTPTSTHAALACAALDAGKHVLVEKPLATSLEECQRVQSAAQGRVVMVGHTFLYNPAIVHLRDLIRREELGSVRYLTSVRAALGPIREDVNVLWDLGPHDLSIFLDLIDSQPVSVTTTGQGYLRNDREDVAYVSIRFDNDVIAHSHLSWLEPYKVRRMTVVGERRMAVFDDVINDERLKILDRGAHYDEPSERMRGATYGEFRAVIRQGAISAPALAPTEPLQEQCREFVQAIQEERPPYTGIAAGVGVVALLEAAQRSLDRGGEPVEPRRPAVESPA